MDQAVVDLIMNGQGSGSAIDRLLSVGGDPGALRPWIGNDGRPYMTVNQRGKPVSVPLVNATATLRKDAWKTLDAAVVKAAKPRLKAVADLRGAGLVLNIPQGMGKTILETETQSDISAADISMDGLTNSTADRPIFELSALPLPLIHKDFHFSMRQVLASRNSGSPIDTTTAELAGRRVAETAEQLLLGTAGAFAYGGNSIYGYTTFPSRLTKTMTAPTASGWTGATFIAEILAMRDQCTAAYHFGPYKIYTSLAWDAYLDADYSVSKGMNTLRQRVEAINGFTGVDTLDYLSTDGSFVVIMVQQTTNVVREVIGMDITTVQWETHGGMRVNFKVMAIMTPQLRADQNDNTGIVHGTT